MAHLKIEDYIPACKIVATNLRRDLHLFTQKYKGIDTAFLTAFERTIDGANKLESFFTVKEEQKALTVKLRSECYSFVDMLIFMKSYLKKTGLNYNIITEVINQFRNRNMEGAIKSCRDALSYYSSNAGLLAESDMPNGYLDSLYEAFARIEALNNRHNTFIVTRKEKISSSRAVYGQLHEYLSKICAAGKLIFKNDPVRCEEYTVDRIARVLQASRKRRDNAAST